ncbi:MAG: EAL domain-containing protein [Alphaproteobacteria bacterium]|nr:EAL domain-containing protein [Alphaproteobacteria bacterium]
MPSPRLFVLDDDPVLRDFVSMVAQKCDFDVTALTRPSELPDALAQGDPDVIFLDLKLGEGTGVDVLETLAGRSCRSEVVLMSGCDQRVLSSSARIGEDLGLRIGGTLPKPFKTSQLKTMLSGITHTGGALTVEDIDEAIQRDAFCLFYQPQIDPVAGTVHGAEALIRWPHASKGMVGPGDFIPLAESSGRISEMTYWVMRTGFSWCAALSARTGNRLRISVNVPPTSVGLPDFVSRTVAMAEASGLEPETIVLELTESSPLTDTPGVMAALSRLRIAGFDLALDDFGTGYSSLVGLHRMPFSELKIDRSFVGKIDKDPDARKIVEATISLAHVLGLRTVAEGVEDARGVEMVRDMGCDLIQGFHYSRPLPAERFDTWFTDWRTETANAAA